MSNNRLWMISLIASGVFTLLFGVMTFFDADFSSSYAFVLQFLDGLSLAVFVFTTFRKLNRNIDDKMRASMKKLK